MLVPFAFCFARLQSSGSGAVFKVLFLDFVD